MTIEKILFYGIIIVGAALIIGLTYYRIDWARHPEKYQALCLLYTSPSPRDTR